MSEGGHSPSSKRAKFTDGATERTSSVTASPVLQEQLEQRLTLVTFNVAGCEPSQAAPKSWTENDSVRAIQKEVLTSNPDIIAIQEIPMHYFRTHPTSNNDDDNIFPGYKVVGTKSSHAPHVVLLVRKEMNATRIDSTSIRHLPAVVGELQFDVGSGMSQTTTHLQQQQHLLQRQQCRLWIASVHLEPFGEGASKRKQQLKSLVKAANRQQIPLIIAGDTNMRVSEDSVAENASDRGGLGLVDLWKLAGSDIRTKYTVCYVVEGSR
jgi:endonuclease/exonuclease/phosphatase family metal-dependent hydrolase